MFASVRAAQEAEAARRFKAAPVPKSLAHPKPPAKREAAALTEPQEFRFHADERSQARGAFDRRQQARMAAAAAVRYRHCALTDRYIDRQREGGPKNWRGDREKALQEAFSLASCLLPTTLGDMRRCACVSGEEGGGGAERGRGEGRDQAAPCNQDGPQGQAGFDPPPAANHAVIAPRNPPTQRHLSMGAQVTGLRAQSFLRAEAFM